MIDARHILAAAMMALAAGTALARVPASTTPGAPACAPAKVTWSYEGTGKGGAAAQADNASATFSQAAVKGGDTPAFVMTVDAGPAGVYQLNADFDVKRLTQEGVLTLVGATSAIPGRAFDVRMAAGDDGTSTFSRPIATTGAPFRIELRTRGPASIVARNVTLCRLR